MLLSSLVLALVVTVSQAPLAAPQKLASVVRSKRAPVKLQTTARNGVTATDLSAVMKSHPGRTKGDVNRYEEYAKHFVANGRRWGVNPLLVACVTYIESGFKAKVRTRWSTKCERKLVWCPKRPGPCRPWDRMVCKRTKINAGEAGMMQTLWYDRSTRAGYKKCTGKDLITKHERRRKTRKQRRAIAWVRLSPPKVSICVGSYEMSKWKRWATRGGYGRIACWRFKRWRRIKPLKGWRWCPLRMKPRAKWNVKFFKKRPRLRRHFWVSFFNWGSNKWVGNYYPRAVLRCFVRYRDGLRKLYRSRTASSK